MPRLFLRAQPSPQLTTRPGTCGCRVDWTEGRQSLPETDEHTDILLLDSKDLYSECLRTFWTCPNCDLYMPLTPLERMQHEASCRPAGEQQQEWEEPAEQKAGPSSVSSLSRVYYCDVCNEDLTLTSTEILKHKRQHMSSVK